MTVIVDVGTALEVEGSSPTPFQTPQRQTVEVDIGVVASNETSVGQFEMPAGVILRTIETNASMRVRLYPTASARDADITRPLGVDRTQGSSTFLEFYSVTGLLDAILSPAVDCFTEDGFLYYSVQNKSLINQPLTMIFSYLPTEV